MMLVRPDPHLNSTILVTPPETEPNSLDVHESIVRPELTSLTIRVLDP
jgi:hypothetical protein